MAATFCVYVKELATGEVVRTIEIQERHMYPGALDKIVDGLTRNMDLDRFTVDDDEAQKEALRRFTRKAKGR